MKETYYFSHDYNARNDRKMQRLIMKQGVEGVGIFWCIVEMLYEEGGSMLLSECERISFELRTDCERINFVLLESELFDNDGKTFWSNSVLDRLNKRKEKSVKAKESADKRWAYANALRLECDGNAIKDSKPKETKEKKEFDLSFLENNQEISVAFKEWLDYRQGSDSVFLRQIEVEKSFSTLLDLSKNKKENAKRIVDKCIESKSKSLFLPDFLQKEYQTPQPIPKQHMPR